MLWAYKITRKLVTQETPFALAFGTEAVAPVKIGLKSLRIELASVEHNEEALRLNLDLLDEKRDQTPKTTKGRGQGTTTKSYKPAREDPTHGKLGPNWEGPYIVSHVVRPGNYELQMEEGKILPHSWNAEHLKRFYQ